MHHSQAFLYEILQKAKNHYGTSLSNIAKKSQLSPQTLYRLERYQKISPRSSYRLLCLYYSMQSH